PRYRRICSGYRPGRWLDAARRDRRHRKRITPMTCARAAPGLGRVRPPSGRAPRASRYVLEAHPHARLQQRRRITFGIKHGHLGATDNLPATGRFARVDGRETAGQTDRSAVDTLPWPGPARHRQSGIPTAEIRETGGESRKGYLPFSAGVRLNDRLGIEASVFGDVGQVGTVVAHRDA